MCLVVCRFDPSLAEPFLLIGNRDEFHARQTEDLHHWKAPHGIAGGRDLQAGGTWLAAHASGRFATITNSRDGAPNDPQRRSRGLLVSDFLESRLTALEYLHGVRGCDYAGFNLLLFDGSEMAYGSNRDPSGPRRLDAGIYAVSNAVLDTPWHKLERAKRRFSALLDTKAADDSALFAILRDEERAPIADVDDRFLPIETAHRVTAAFVNDKDYGTRCSSIVRWHQDTGFHLVERRFGPNATMTGETVLQLGGRAS